MYTVYILPFRYRAFENWIQFAHTDRAQCDNSIADWPQKTAFPFARFDWNELLACGF